MSTETKEKIRYYDWEGDACRVIKNSYGNINADLYRSGKGLIDVNPSDVVYRGKQIGEKTYKELVMLEIELNAKDEA